VFGGTFDPPHLAHLAIAEWAADALRLERVLFVPAGQPPHKSKSALSAAAHRLAMTRLAVRGNARFAVATLELSRPGPSYTVDTLRALQARFPLARLHLIMGADMLADVPNWHEAGALGDLATLVVAGRPGGRARRPWRGVVMLDNPPLLIASHAVRTRVREGRSVRYLVPDAVLRYIARHRLYRTRRAPARNAP